MNPRKLINAVRENRWPLRAAKLAIVLLVVFFVGEALREAWQQLSTQRLELDLPLAFASGAVFLAGQAPMAWFWRQTLTALGQPRGWASAVRAFYVSQLGKYVPGKASVVLIRTERTLKQGGCGKTIAACVFYETLTHMAVGGLLSALLLSAGVGGIEPRQRTVMTLVALAMTVVCFVPTWPPLARGILVKLAPSVHGPRESPDEPSQTRQTESALRRGLTVGLLLEGLAASLLSWCLMGVSVWLASRAVGATDGSLSGPHWPWVLAAALPVAAGFLSLLPAGVLVRDGLMLVILAPTLGEAGALATTVAVRLIWVISEVVLCGILAVVWRVPR